jgi:hypothetical protein
MLARLAEEVRDALARPDSGYSGGGPQAMATLRNIGISLPHLAGITETLQRITRNRTRACCFFPYERQLTNDFAHHMPSNQLWSLL